MTTARLSLSTAAVAAALCALLLVALFLSLCVGAVWYPPPLAARGLLALAGAVEPEDPTLQRILELRLWRALTTAGVGASLALSGGLLQGLFRNPLAAPSLLGVTSGASLGATVAILIVGGYAPNLVMESSAGLDALLIPALGFLGALGAVSLVALLASPGGRVSTPTLLLVGIAVNLCLSGAFMAIQSLVLRDWEVSRAILSWTFGVLDDRKAMHAATVGVGLLLACLAVPRVALELDLFRGGEEDASALGVDTPRVKALCIGASALTAACAVAVAGQIAFVGLIVPHVVRLLAGSLYRRVLPLCVPAGALFLVATDLAQRALLGRLALPPGVLMSLAGGPFLLFLILRNRREVAAW